VQGLCHAETTGFRPRIDARRRGCVTQTVTRNRFASLSADRLPAVERGSVRRLGRAGLAQARGLQEARQGAESDA
jgi:hypothetical protein